MAAEAGVEAEPEGMPIARRAQARVAAMLDFEVTRDPRRPNATIARACRSSVVAVSKARERLDLPELG